MAQHYTLKTVSASAWCPRCAKHTQHRVDNRRIGPCLDCIAEREREHEELKKRPPVAVQGGLF